METSTMKQQREQIYIDNMTKLRNQNIDEFFNSGQVVANISLGISYPQKECTIPVHCWDDYVKDRLAVFEQALMLSFMGFNRNDGIGGFVGEHGSIREMSVTYNVICTDKDMLESKVKNLRDQLFQESILVRYSREVINFI